MILCKEVWGKTSLVGLNSHGILVLVEVSEEVTIVTPYITTEEFNSIGTTEFVQSQLEMGKNLTSNYILIHKAISKRIS